MRRDIDTVSGSGPPDFKLITASDTRIIGTAPDGTLDVSDEVIRLSHSSDQIKKTTEYLFSDKHVDSDILAARKKASEKAESEIRKDLVDERKNKLEFIFDPEYDFNGGQSQ